MHALSEPITVAEVSRLAEGRFGNMVKAVVDVRRGLIVMDADLHADEEAHLLELGSSQVDLWGINLHPDAWGTTDFIEFDSMINLRPSQGNRSRDVEDPAVRALVVEVVGRWVLP